jgi:FimV-like protein
MIAGKISFNAPFVLAILPLFFTATIIAAVIDTDKLDSIANEYPTKVADRSALDEDTAVPSELSVDFDSRTDGSYHLVGAGETLWSLSAKICPPVSTVWQVMDAVFLANPNAFLNNDPSKIIMGSNIVHPSNDFVAIQSGILVADELRIEVYKKKADKSTSENTRMREAKPQEPMFIEIIDQEIQYVLVDDVAQREESTEVAIEVPEQQAHDASIDLLPGESEVLETSDLLVTIDSLSIEVKTLKNKLRIEQKEKNEIVAQAQGLQSSNNRLRWIEQTESKLAVFILIVSIILSASLVVGNRGKENELSNLNSELKSDIIKEVNDVSAAPDQSIFTDNAILNEDVFVEKGESLSDAIKFEFTDDFYPESGEDLDYLDPPESIDPVDVKLDLAQTYADLGDILGAREILKEIISESNKDGIARARAVLEKLKLDSSD